MASSILKGLVTNYGIDRQKWHRPFTKRKSAVAAVVVTVQCGGCGGGDVAVVAVVVVVVRDFIQVLR